MCGILGLYAPSDRTPVDRAQRALDIMRSRGPDGSGLVSGDLAASLEPVGQAALLGPVVLGHRRLAIVDLDPSASQPMSDASGRFWVTYNGEIYNHRELRRELEDVGCAFRTSHSDTEVILQGYVAWGESVFARLNGMFSVAVLDRSERVLTLARDRFGQKPLYYCHRPRRSFSFASDLRALVALGTVSPDVDGKAVGAYLGYGYVPEGHAIFAGARKLPPGHRLRIKLDSLGREATPRAYWRPPMYAPVRETDAAARKWQASFDHTLDDAVAIRLQSDVPIGLFLSGGLDSTRIAIAATRASDDIRTFTTSFGESAYDEREAAHFVAHTLGSEHRVLELSPSDLLEAVPDLIAATSEPFADASTLALLMMCRAARTEITVALGGDGGDELSGGYARYRMHDAWGRGLPKSRAMRPCMAMARKVFPQWVRGRALIDLLRHDELSRYHALTTDAWLAANAGMRFEPVGPSWSDMEARRLHNADPTRRAMETDRNAYLPGDILTKADRASMAVSLELRAPYMDHRLWELAARAPSAWLYGAEQAKRPIASLVGATLGTEFAQRPKQGFTIPLGLWMRGPLRDEVSSVLLRRGGVCRTLFGERFLLRLLRYHRFGSRDQSARLWRLYMLERTVGEGSAWHS